MATVKNYNFDFPFGDTEIVFFISSNDFTHSEYSICHI